MRRAVEALDVTPEHLLIDARKLHELPIPQTRIVKGDGLTTIGRAKCWGSYR